MFDWPPMGEAASSANAKIDYNSPTLEQPGKDATQGSPSRNTFAGVRRNILKSAANQTLRFSNGTVKWRYCSGKTPKFI